MADPEEAADDESDDNEVFMTPAPHRSAMPRDDSDDENDGAAAEEDDDTGIWGTTKQDYYGADDMETEQDALDEETEAKRIQQKQLQGMTAADYGFDEDEWQDSKKDAAKEKNDKAVVTEVLPQMKISEDMSPAERLKLLKSRYPEFEPLSKDFLELQEEMKELRKDAIHAQEYLKSPGIRIPEGFVPVAVTKHRAASAYITVLSMYFALLTSQAKDIDAVALPLNVLRDHPVMDSLLKSREMWLKAKVLPGEELVGNEADAEADGDSDEVDEDLEELSDTLAKPKKQLSKKTKAQKAAAAADAEAEARRAEKMAKTEADLMDLDALLGQKPSKKKKAAKPVQFLHGENDSDFGDETELTAQEQADKDKKRKSLRFYTSQIAQKANKRGAAGRNAGGDDDIPYRERLKDKQARLMAEAEKRGRKPTAAGEELGGESDEEDRRQAKEIRGEADSEDDYYDMVAAKSSKKKSDKKALADAQREAAASGGRVVEQEVVGADGKRKISYLIEKNKGLTPHRKKDVRNPRVKKRKKYEEKTKKLASMKPTYKGGEGRGGYGGEMTGIKSGIVKSTKL